MMELIQVLKVVILKIFPMIRFKLDIDSTNFIDSTKTLYNFSSDGLIIRISLSLSLAYNKNFDIENENMPRNGREYTQTNNTFGKTVNGVDNYVIYKALLNQHYKKDLLESEFIRAFKLHLVDGINIWKTGIEKSDITRGEHISFLLKPIKSGLNLRSINNILINPILNQNSFVNEFKKPLSFELGYSEKGEPVLIKINDINQFDNRNVAIAGMAGSGKTQLIRDILYQIKKNSNDELKFIFFDYKGEGNPSQLKPFLDATKCEFVDIINDNGLRFNPLLSINSNEKYRPFNIIAFVDTVAAFVPNIGIGQKNILVNVITDLFDSISGEYPTINELFQGLVSYYEKNNLKPDVLYASIQNLSTNIFNCDVNNPSILNNSLYLNLPPALSDTLRQLVVFLLLRYFHFYFSSTNDCEPINNIFPLRYVIVIDEAHVYLKNKNARKALEEILRLLRSKGVVIFMLSQGVEDFKTKEFDFASQVKLPICLNIQNKEYKAIASFVGTPNSKFKLESEIKKLESGKGLINIVEPQIIDIRQWWKTKEVENL